MIAHTIINWCTAPSVGCSRALVVEKVVAEDCLPLQTRHAVLREVSDADGERDLGGGEGGVQAADGQQVHIGGGQGGRVVQLYQLTRDNLLLGVISQG